MTIKYILLWQKALGNTPENIYIYILLPINNLQIEYKPERDGMVTDGI